MELNPLYPMMANEISEIMIREIEDVTAFDLDLQRDKIQFLAQLVGVPLTSVIGNDERLLEEIKNWISY